ncbi:flavodoxin domain-containing protein [Cellulomonas soli]
MHLLVTVASRHGATQEIGAEVAQVLRAAGHEVDEVPPDDVEGVRGYDAVVLGSAVYVGRLAASLRDLVDRQAGQLKERPTWLFWSGPIGDPPMPATVPDDVTAVATRTGSADPQAFAGRLERADLNLSERALVALTRAEPGDYRDLDEVRAWAATIVRELAAVRPHQQRR